MSIVFRFAFVAVASLLLTGCPGGGNIVPAMKQLPPEAQVLLATKGMKQESPLFVRIFKEESELEIWKQKDDGRYYHFKTYPICAWSGTLGPKVRVGDKQAPEGFYTVTPGQMNPNSKFHLAFNLGFPNAYDKANGRSGDALMVHGNCKSAGCFAMTDALIEEIYVLARESFQGGQKEFHVHAFPFRMTEANLTRHRGSQWHDFWKTLKEGYDTFEAAQMPPKVAVCSKQYLLNANFMGQEAVPDPQANCPAYKKTQPQPFEPFSDGPTLINAKAEPQAAAQTRVAAINGQSRDPSVQSLAAQAMRSAGEKPQPQALTASPPVLAGAVAAIPLTPQARAAVAAPQMLAPQGSAPHSGQQPAAAAPAQSAAVAAPAESKPLETRGIHNVVQSGKSDMIISAPGQAAAQPVQYGYGQTNTAASVAPLVR